MIFNGITYDEFNECINDAGKILQPLPRRNVKVGFGIAATY